MPDIPYHVLNDGHHIPLLGFGTWPMDDDTAEAATGVALATGYRLIDTAARYGNEAGVGAAIRNSGIPRTDIFLTSKLHDRHHGYDSAFKGFEASLERLGTDYLDLYLIHWPLPEKNLYVDAWRALTELREQGRIKSIGVSNFEPHHLDRLIRETGEIPAVNQIELHPDFAQPALRKYNADRQILTQSWSPISRGRISNNSELVDIAARHGKSVEQVILRWHVQSGLVPIPKSQDATRILGNFQVFDFQLDDADMTAIQALDCGARSGAHPDSYVET